MLCRCCLALWLWRWRAQGLLSVSGAVEPPWMKRLINWALSDRATIRIYAQTVSLLHSESNSLKRTMNFWRVASRIGACKRSVPKEPNNFAFSILWTLLDTLLPNPCSLASLLCHSQEFPHHTIRMWQGAPAKAKERHRRRRLAFSSVRQKRLSSIFAVQYCAWLQYWSVGHSTEPAICPLLTW